MIGAKYFHFHFQKYFILIVLVCGIFVVSLVFWHLNKQNKQTEQPEQQEQEQQTETQVEGADPSSHDSPDLNTKEGLLKVIKSAGEQEDYDSFAKYLKMAYERLWNTEEDFNKTESETYTRVTDNYFRKGQIKKALEISSIVYDEVPQGWRFRYLRIRCLETFGREAFEQGDLQIAEEYAITILQMLYRPEGANLLADIYIQKIEADLAANDKEAALNNLNYIWDYEVSQDRRDELIELKALIDADLAD